MLDTSFAACLPHFETVHARPVRKSSVRKLRGTACWLLQGAGQPRLRPGQARPGPSPGPKPKAPALAPDPGPSQGPKPKAPGPGPSPWAPPHGICIYIYI